MLLIQLYPNFLSLQLLFNFLFNKYAYVFVPISLIYVN